MNGYINYLKACKCSDGTIEQYTIYVGKMLKYVNKDVKDICTSDIINWMASISNLASATIAMRVAAVKSYFKYCTIVGIVSNNPAEKIEAPVIKNKAKHYMSANMVKTMIDKERNARNKAMVSILANTGLRFSEFQSITINQWDKMIADGTHQLKIVGKGNKERFIYINPNTESLINKYVATRKNGCDKLFVSDQGTPMNECSVRMVIKRMGKVAGIPFYEELSPHCLRSACATILNDNNVPIGHIRDVLGHASIATTSRYIKTNQEDIKFAMMNSYI